MLVVRVEIWPGGDPERAQEIGRMGLANVSNLAEDSTYVFTSLTDRHVEAEGIIRNHTRSSGFWRLVERAARLASKGGNVTPKCDADTLETLVELVENETSPKILRRK